MSLCPTTPHPSFSGSTGHLRIRETPVSVRIPLLPSFPGVPTHNISNLPPNQPLVLGLNGCCYECSILEPPGLQHWTPKAAWWPHLPHRCPGEQVAGNICGVPFHMSSELFHLRSHENNIQAPSPQPHESTGRSHTTGTIYTPHNRLSPPNGEDGPCLSTTLLPTKSRQGLVFIQVEERGREFTPFSLVQLPAQLHQDKVLATLTRASEPEVRATEGERRGSTESPMAHISIWGGKGRCGKGP